ncbi:viroplasmin family protein [Vagococcus bubulae]|nr:ribonuclease H family protein [Vagococcus bubulae]
MSKYYAVKSGIRPGVYTSWKECEKHVKGFSGATYKSFSSLEEAERYLSKGDETLKVSQSSISESDFSNSVDIYVDGSWCQSKEQYGWGFVAVIEDDIKFTQHGKSSNPKYTGSKQVGGEIVAVLQGIDYAIKNGYDHVTIHYDYMGIEKWASGEWKANVPISEAYVYYMEKKVEKINLSFVKVKAHSHNKYNDMADRLAKKGAFK